MAMKSLKLWAQRCAEPFDVDVPNLTKCWKDGRVFCTLISAHRYDLLAYDDVKEGDSESDAMRRLELSFGVAEQLGFDPFLDPEDVWDCQDKKCIVLAVSQYFHYFKQNPSPSSHEAAMAGRGKGGSPKAAAAPARTSAAPAPTPAPAPAPAADPAPVSKPEAVNKLRAIGHRVGDDLVKAFKKFDINGDGMISDEEYAYALRLLGEDPTPLQIKTMLRAADTNGDGHIDFEEFCAASSFFMATSDKLEDDYLLAFRSLDTENKGYLTVSEFEVVLRDNGADVQEIAALVKYFDSDGNGQIDFSEFVPAMRSGTNGFVAVSEKKLATRHRSSSRAPAPTPEPEPTRAPAGVTPAGQGRFQNLDHEPNVAAPTALPRGGTRAGKFMGHTSPPAEKIAVTLYHFYRGNNEFWISGIMKRPNWPSEYCKVALVFSEFKNVCSVTQEDGWKTNAMVKDTWPWVHYKNEDDGHRATVEGDVLVEEDGSAWFWKGNSFEYLGHYPQYAEVCNESKNRKPSKAAPAARAAGPAKSSPPARTWGKQTAQPAAKQSTSSPRWGGVPAKSQPKTQPAAAKVTCKCGAAVSATSKFCSSCGGKMGAGETVTVTESFSIPAMTPGPGNGSQYAIDVLRAKPPPDGVDPHKLEEYLSDADFVVVLGVTRADFKAMPKWKQTKKKQDAGIF